MKRATVSTVLFLLLSLVAYADPEQVGALYRAAGEELVQAVLIGVPGGDVGPIPSLSTDNMGVPDAAPQGGRIAFVRIPEEEHYQLVVRDLGSGQEKLLLEGNSPLLSPIWSPDGKKLVCSRYNRETKILRLVVLEPDGGTHQELDCGPNLALAPAWSPDGQRLALTSVSIETRLPQLAVVSSAGGDLRVLGKEFAAEPSWSPDGQQLVYVGPGPNDAPALYLCGADGSGARLLPGGEGGASPRWLASSIVFNRPTEGGVMEIRSIPASGGESSRVSPEGATAILSDAQAFFLPFYMNLGESPPES
ncbi:MAG: PD40 domain-containing protein [Armatimonadetes bacterium]|nr:PD40 domain-containing protein [Armatimonadota bacterium]